MHYLVSMSNDFTFQQDHGYAVASNDALKQKLFEAQERVEVLKKQVRNAKDRERRTKKTLKTVLAELKEKNLITQELKTKLDMYSGEI